MSCPAYSCPHKDFDAIIDTGAYRIVSIPMLDAFPLGLVLNGTTSVTLADGSTAPKLTGIGTVTVAGEKRVGVIQEFQKPLASGSAP